MKPIVRYLAILLCLLTSAGPTLADDRVYFLLHYLPGKAYPGADHRDNPTIQRHHAFLKQLAREGRLLLGGPLEGGQGDMMLVTADSLEKADDLVALDPAVTEGLLQVKVSPWTVKYSNMRYVKPRQGSADLSAGESFRIKRHDPQSSVRQDP